MPDRDLLLEDLSSSLIVYRTPVYANDEQFNVIQRSFEMMGKAVGLPNNKVDKFVQDWSAKYRLGDSVKMVYYSNEAPREITDSEFAQMKQQGFTLSLIKSDTHAEVIADLKARVKRYESEEK